MPNIKLPSDVSGLSYAECFYFAELNNIKLDLRIDGDNPANNVNADKTANQLLQEAIDAINSRISFLPIGGEVSSILTKWSNDYWRDVKCEHYNSLVRRILTH